MNKMYEKFSWFRDDVKLTSQVGNKIRIKGRALHATVSRNDRKYIDDELLRSARTLANKPIDVNHAVSRWEALAEAGHTHEPKPKHVGHVLDADYEDGFIEYIAEINDSEYVAKLKDREALTKESYIEKWGKDPIYGVSVDAVYRYPQSETEKGDITVPLGIQFIRLSLVEDPEKPGIRDTTIKIMEMSLIETTVVGNIIKDFAPDLFETYEKEVISKMNEKTGKDAPNFAVSNQDTLAYGPRRSCELSRGDIPESEYTFGEAEVEEKPSLGERFGLTEERLGEPFADYADFAACTAANQDKDDPDAYCASIKQKVEGETEVTEKEHGDKEKHKKKKKADESSPRYNIRKIEKIIFKPLSKEPPKAKKVAEIAEGKAEVSEVKPLVNEEKDMSLKEQQDKEIRELATKQFRDRNDIEHTEFRTVNDALGVKINELVELRPKDADSLRSDMMRVIGENKTSLMNTITELEAQNKTLAGKNNELVDAFEAQKTSYSTENEGLRESITSLEAENESIKTVNGEMRTTIDGHKSSLESLETRIGEYEEFKTAIAGVHDGFEERIASLEEFKAGYPEEKESIETKIAELEASLSGVKTKIEEIEAEPKENPLEEQVNKLEETLENLKTHVKSEFKAPENLEADPAPSVSLEVDPVKG